MNHDLKVMLLPGMLNIRLGRLAGWAGWLAGERVGKLTGSWAGGGEGGQAGWGRRQ